MMIINSLFARSKNLLPAIVFLVVACSPQEYMLSEPDVRDGASIAATLTGLYNDTAANCGTDSKPAFLCSGITLRATETNQSFFPWNPSPNSQTRGGVPFSWLRKDSNFSRAAFSYLNGFIFYPVLTKPSAKQKIEVLCYFPVDADSVKRPTLSGCGAHSSYPTNSGLCHEQTPKVDTAATWLTHFNQIQNTAGGIQQHAHQCAFDVRDKVNYHAGPNFLAGVNARKNLGDADKRIQNEMMLATWAQNIPGQLPIMAFYYLGGTNQATGLANAKIDQKRFYDETKGQVVPIIKMTLPDTFTGTATFIYSASDQAVR